MVTTPVARLAGRSAALPAAGHRTSTPAPARPGYRTLVTQHYPRPGETQATFDLVLVAQ